MSDKPSLEVFQDWLEDYLNFERTPKKNIFWLDTMKFLCKRFHNPEKAFNSVHVAGSKGKGSVSVMLASILDAAKFKTGLYTSPHILNFNERIRLVQTPFPEEIYEKTVKEMIYSVDAIIPEQLPGMRPITWFELVTLFSFLCFRQAKCDWAVYETGLGGRLDSTNVIMPKISVITSIELEHTEFLGDTIEKIAYEKAGIIKNNTPVCCAAQSNNIKKIFIDKAKENNSSIFFVDEIIKIEQCNYKENKMEIILDSPLLNRKIKTKLSLLGKFQAENAALAVLTTKVLFPNIDETTIEEGLSKANLPGRFEIIDLESNKIVLDGAHTVKSITYTIQTFRECFKESFNKAHILFACAADKDVEHIAEQFKDFNNIILTRPGEIKESDTIRLKNAFSKINKTCIYLEDYKEAIKTAINNAKAEKVPLLITGSFYLLAEVKKILL